VFQSGESRVLAQAHRQGSSHHAIVQLCGIFVRPGISNCDARRSLTARTGITACNCLTAGHQKFDNCTLDATDQPAYFRCNLFLAGWLDSQSFADVLETLQV
jgi:hypothetical protein